MRPRPFGGEADGYGKGRGGELVYDVTVPAGGRTDVWFAVGGSESGADGARVEQAGAMPEIASPTPLDGDILNRPFNERPMVLEAWGNYGTA